MALFSFGKVDIVGDASAKLNNRYEIIEVTHQGARKIVYKAEDKLEKKTVALNEIDLSKLSEFDKAEIQQTLQMEMDYLIKLEHRNLVKYLDHFQSSGKFYFVTEWVDGPNLKSVMKKLKRPLRGTEVINLFFSLTEFLDYIHNQDPPYFLRVLKPSDLIVGQDKIIKIVDLGTDLEMDPYYSSDERYIPNEDPDERRDIFILGALIYELVTGLEPGQFKNKPLPPAKDINKDVNKALSDIISKCLEGHKNRYRNLRELRSDIAKWFPEYTTLTSLLSDLTPEEEIKIREKSVMKTKVGCVGCFFIALGITVWAILYLPGIIKEWYIERFEKCASNIEKISVAVLKYQAKNKKLPENLNELLPNYLDTIPQCPMARDAFPYIHSYEYNDESGNFTIYCAGHFHKFAGAPRNYPIYSKKWGLQKKQKG